VAERARGRWGLPATLALAAGAGTLVHLLFVPLVRHWDLLVFLGAGQDVAAGRNPYPALDSPQLYDGHQFVYPYLTALPFAALSWLPPAAVYPLYFAVSVAAIALACWLLRPRRPVAVVFVLCASVTVIGLQMGTVNPFLMLAVAAAWRFRDRTWAVALGVGAAVELKVFLLPLVAWLVLAGRFRAVAATAAVAALLLGAGWIAGPLGPLGYERVLGRLSAHEGTQGSSLAALLHDYGLGPAAATAGTVLVSAGLLVAAWWGYRRGRDERLPFATALVCCLLLSPIVWMHYFLLLAVVLLVVAADPAAVAAVFMAVSWLVVKPHHVALAGTQQVVVTVLGIGLLAGGCLAEAVAWRAVRAPSRAGRIAGVAAVALLIGVMLVPHTGSLPPEVCVAVLLWFVWVRTAPSPHDRAADVSRPVLAERWPRLGRLWE
jgi:alpha-1,2-mannosyltransferase